MGLFTLRHEKNDFAGVVARSLQAQTDYPSPDSSTDDSFTLSYEAALKKHTRRPLAEELSQLSELAMAELESRRVPEAAPTIKEEVAPGPITSEAVAVLTTTITKAASITLRMSKEESALLRKRAASARITVSAYIRSCIFEAEELRAQVKNTLAEIKLTRLQRHG